MIRLFSRRRPAPVAPTSKAAPKPFVPSLPHPEPEGLVLVIDQPPAAPAPLARARRTEYLVTYGPVGIPGSPAGRPTPAPHAVHALGGQALAEAIRRHVAPYLGTQSVFVVVDLNVLGGQLMLSGRKAGLFNLEIIPAVGGDPR